jgi:hypothetical protein
MLSDADGRHQASSVGRNNRRRIMFSKTIAAMALAVFLGTTAAAIAQGWQGGYGFYQDHFGLGYTSSARHDPTDTNGF